MKNKKGFTIIEIIVSLTIILLIGGTVIGLTITNNNKKEEKVLKATKKIQEAAEVYISINKEIDSSIEEKIYEGGTGYIMPLKKLRDEGYISNNHIKTLEDNITGFNINEHYMMMAEYAKTREECDNSGSVIEIEPSWIISENLNHTGSYFICNYEHKENEYHYLFLDVNGGNMTEDRIYIKMSSEAINPSLPTPTKSGYNFDGWYEGTTKVESVNLIGAESKVLKAKWVKPRTIYNEIVKRYENEGISGCIPGVTTGLCMIKGNGITENNKEIYYFAGNSTSNNYVKIGSYDYYIVRTTEDNNIKLVRNLTYNARLHYTDISGNFRLTSNPYIKVSNESIGISSATQNLSYTSNEMTLPLSGMLNISKIYGWRRSSGANSYETPDGLSLCNPTTNNRNWTDDELCYITWCFKSWGGTGNSCNNSTRYNLSFYSPMHSIYLDTISQINSFGIPSNYLATTKWCSNSKYNSSEVKNYCRDEKCFTLFPPVNLTCEEEDYIESKYGLLNKAEYFLITHFTESTYYLHAGELYLYGSGVNNEASYETTLDNTYSYEIIGNTYYFTHGNKENQLKYRPAITIKGNLKITSGDGSYDNPYKLSL